MSSAVVEQTFAEGFETIRPHRLAIGLYAVSTGPDGAPRLTRTDRLELDLSGARTEIPELIGREQPDLLLVNDDDLTYAKIRLDQRSLATALEHVRSFESSLPKSLVLASAWDMTRDAEMGARTFVDLVLAVLPGESDSPLIRTLLAQLSTAVHLYVAPEHRDAVRRSTLERLWEAATVAEPSSDAQLQLVSAAAGFTTTGDDTTHLRGLLDGTRQLEGLALDTDMRWTLLTGLAGAGVLEDGEVDAELQRDPTATGRERAARAHAAVPTPEAKEAAWKAAIEDDGLSNSMVDAYGLGFGRLGDVTALEPFVDRYHAALESLKDKCSMALVESIVVGFYPRGLASAELRDATQEWLDTHTDAPDALRRLVAENRDPITRALAAQERDARA